MRDAKRMSVSMRIGMCVVLTMFLAVFAGLPRSACATVTNYTITMTGGTGGTISYGSGAGLRTSTNGTDVAVTVPDNQNAVFTITPNAGYVIQSITVDSAAVSIASSYTFYKTISGNHTLNVTFVARWTITLNQAAGGTLTDSANSQGPFTVNNGSTPTFVITADSSHYVTGVTVSGAGKSTADPLPKSTSYTFALNGVTANTTVTPIFSLRPTFTISTEVWSLISGSYQVSTTGGNVSMSFSSAGGGTVSGTTATVYEGNSIIFTSTPASGYALRGIFYDTVSPYTNSSANGQSATSPFTFTPTSSAKFWFRFRPTTSTITATAHPDSSSGATPGQGGTIFPSGIIDASNFGTYTYTATPATGYSFSYVTVCNTTDSPAVCSNVTDATTLPEVTISGTTVTITRPTKTYTVDAYFTSNNYTFTTSAQFANPPAGFVPPALNTVVSPTSASVPFNTSSPTFTFTPPSGWAIQSVTDTVGGVTTLLGAPTSWTWSNVSADHSIAVTFVQRVNYHLYVTNGGNGTITNSAGLLPASAPAGTTDYTVSGGDNVTFTFAASAGYVIKNVVLDNVSLGPLTSYTFRGVGTDHSISVTFINAYSITAAAGAHGAVSPGGTVWVSSGASKTFVITPDSGYAIQDVVVNGVSRGPIASYTFSSVSASGQTISATFVSSGVPLSTYCDLPAFIGGNIRPNLLLLLDNSASMYDLAYTSTSTFCFDDTYDDTGSYVGYFNQAAMYSYDALNNVFNSGATMPAGGCTDVTTGYVCVSMTGTAPNRTVSQFVASGKFLNWLSASKLDVEKQALTGGKYDDLRSVLVGETRGCLGKRFVKMIADSNGRYYPITFTARGPGAFEADFTNPVAQGGTTRIEIYDGTYNASACQAAVTDWQNLSLTGTGIMGQIDNETVACLGGTGSKVGAQVANYQHQMHNCYWFFAGHSLSNDNTLQNNCEKLYDTYYNHDPAQIVNSGAADAVCSSVLTHPMFTPANNNSPNTTGYIGKCATYNTGNNKWTWDDNCTVTEMEDFCTNISANDVSDPSTSTYITGTTMTVPSFLSDAGVTPLGSAAATFLVNISQPSPPVGLIDQFKNMINFGAMTFNFDGTASECGQTGTGITCPKTCSVTTTQQCVSNADCPATESCSTGTTRDGGKIISYVNYDPVGDHTAGLISTIDGIQATSWTPFSEAFYDAIGYFANRTDLRLNSTDFDASKPPSQYSCQKNNVLLVTDGMSTADRNSTVMSLVNLYKSPSYNAGTAPGNVTTSLSATAPTYAGSTNLDDLTWLAQHKSIANFANIPANDSQKITTHVIYSGDPCASADAAGVCTSNDETIPEVELQHAASYGGGLFQLAQAGSLQQNLLKAFQLIATQASSGTAASILSNSEGSGANILQAIFYPKKTFDNGATNASWIGELHNLWYYVDPFIGKSTVRENTADPSPLPAANTRYFNLKQDYEVRFVFDTATNETTVARYKDTDGDGLGDLYIDTVMPEQVNSLWRAGRQLWSRTAARTIYTQTGSGLTSFIDTSVPGNVSLLQATNQSEADRIVNFVKGYIGGTEDAGYRSRSLVIPPPIGPDNTARIWRLGDIISSTPRVQSSVRLGNYNLVPSGGYKDTSYIAYIAQTNYTSYNIDYPNRGMAYVGANDGMMHAFKLGNLSVADQDDLKATLAGTTLGEEQWAFIPKNALPYLKYTADKNYSHLYFVDGPTSLVDTSTAVPSAGGGAGCTAATYWNCSRDFTNGTNWKTILIGSMGLGGASRDSAGSCNNATTNCVKSPIANGGYSSYFALDITNQSFDPTTGNLRGQPSFLWEFSDPALGYATSGPAIVKIKATNTTGDDGMNGKWFAVFASGPTGPIDSSVCQFKGYSDQPLRIFVVDLMTGALLKTFSSADLPSNAFTNGFAGSITNGVIDADRWNKNSTGFYQDDEIFIPYVKTETNGGVVTWTDGGILRLTTKEDMDPNNWVLSTVIDGIGAVTTNVAKLQDRKNHKLWLYFGTGRYFSGGDDHSTRRKIFGLMDPCYTASDAIDKTCTASRSLSDLTNQTSSPSATLGTLANAYTDDKGWYISLDAEDTTNNYGAERIITDPVAMTNGVVFFTSFEPTTDVCKFGGQSFLWAAKYDTGFQAPAPALQGKALVQVSTGSFQQIDLSTAFGTYGSHDGRRMSTGMAGKPPSDPPPIVSKSNLKPVKKILHIQEK